MTYGYSPAQPRFSLPLVDRALCKRVPASLLPCHRRVLPPTPCLILSLFLREPWEEGRAGIIIPFWSLEELEPGSQQECSNQGQNSNVQTHVLVFLASACTWVIVPRIFWLCHSSYWKPSVHLHFVTSALLSGLHKTTHTQQLKLPLTLSPRPPLVERPGLPRHRVSGPLSAFFPLPHPCSLIHTCSTSSNRSLTAPMSSLAFSDHF